jgi:hypothetical protein
MRNRIRLLDQDRPNEFLEVEVLEAGRDELWLAVPNTIVQFMLRRRGDVFEGSLGGRAYAYSHKHEKVAKSRGLK